MRDFLADTLLVVGLGLFLLSTIQPFLVLTDVTPPDPYDGFLRVISFRDAGFFSFKADYFIYIIIRSVSFDAYWFGSNELNTYSFSPVSYILVAMFTLQIMTLLLGFAVLPLKTRMRMLPLITCLATTLLMTWVYSSLHNVFDYAYFPIIGWHYRWSLANGYWWTYPSILLIIASTILARGRQNKLLFPKADLRAPSS